MSTYCARGSDPSLLPSLLSGSKRHLMVSDPSTERPSVVVAANVKLRSLRSGMRKDEVQPAPRIKRSTCCMMGFLCAVRQWRRCQ